MIFSQIFYFLTPNLDRTGNIKIIEAKHYTKSTQNLPSVSIELYTKYQKISQIFIFIFEALPLVRFFYIFFCKYQTMGRYHPHKKKFCCNFFQVHQQVDWTRTVAVINLLFILSKVAVHNPQLDTSDRVTPPHTLLNFFCSHFSLRSLSGYC